MADLPGTTARMAEACELRDLSDSKEIAALGVKYQLMTQHTNYLALDVKADDEKAGDLPALRKTPPKCWLPDGVVQGPCWPT